MDELASPWKCCYFYSPNGVYHITRGIRERLIFCSQGVLCVGFRFETPGMCVMWLHCPDVDPLTDNTGFLQIYRTSSSSALFPMVTRRILTRCSCGSDWITSLIWSQLKKPHHIFIEIRSGLKWERDHLASGAEAMSLEGKWSSVSEGLFCFCIQAWNLLSSLPVWTVWSLRPHSATLCH